jgi:Hemerythrin HHE cation binding domain
MTATISTIPALTVETAALETVTVDIYRDIHKGIRNELFAVTYAAGRVDPGDVDAVNAVGERWGRLVHLLVSHAQHEDDFVQPVIEVYAPEYASVIARVHPELEAQMAALELLADRAAASCAQQRRTFVHKLYLGLASFTAAYLQHQEFEELQVMPALAAKIEPDGLRALDNAIVASIPPEDLAQSASLMLPAMNVEDRVELLGAIQADAPPEAFAGIIALGEAVLEPADVQDVKVRLGIA